MKPGPVKTRHEVRPGVYCDSVILMQLQKYLLGQDGVLDAGVVMATPTNQALLAESDLLPAGLQARPDDLLIVVKAEGETAASAALQQVDDFFTRRRSQVESEFRPHSLDSALKILPQAGWVAVSVPGRYAAALAREALDHNRHIFIYSDNVSLEDEVELKQAARSKGLLVMGPDCGTALVGGVGFGFANRVRRGRIGLVGASGTGLQALMVEIHRRGSGVSHALGTGGRDLSEAVGGISMRQCLDLLGRDPDTSVIALVSKPPDPGMVPRLLAQAREVGKPVVVYLLGYPLPARQMGSLHFAASIPEAAALAVSLLEAVPGEPSPPGSVDREIAVQTGNAGKYLRGLFSGGTLAYETLLGLRAVVAPLYSNLSLPGVHPLPEPTHSRAHSVIDLGADELTVGRLHPMLDQQVRLRRLKQEARDPETGLIVLDVVLGEGAHRDPASELAPAIASIRQERDLPVVVVLVGTEEDLQDFSAQARRFEEAGALVLHSIRAALETIAHHYSRPPEPLEPPVSLECLQAPPAVVNLGLESFYHSLQSQGAQAVHVDWNPPAGGNERLMSILARMKG